MTLIRVDPWMYCTSRVDIYFFNIFKCDLECHRHCIRMFLAGNEISFVFCRAGLPSMVLKCMIGAEMRQVLCTDTLRIRASRNSDHKPTRVM